MCDTGIMEDENNFDSITDGTVIHITDISGKRYHHSFRKPVTIHFEKQNKMLWYASIDELMVNGEGRYPIETFEDLSSALELLRMTDAKHPDSPMHRIVREHIR